MIKKIFFVVTFGALFLLQADESLSKQVQNKLSVLGENTLLVINFNHPYYGNIEFFEKCYGQIFPHIVYYGEKEHPKVHQMAQLHGCFAYNTLADAMKRYPEYDAYLWLNDDCCFSMARVLRFSLNKIWSNRFNVIDPYNQIRVKEEEFSPDEDPSFDSTVWLHWDREYGAPALRRVLEELPKKYGECLHKKYADKVPFGPSEAFYIPKRYVAPFIELADLCLKHELFIEIAFPLIISCLDSESAQYETTELLWGVKTYKEAIQYDFFHPVKLSSSTNHEFINRLVHFYRYLDI